LDRSNANYQSHLAPFVLTTQFLPLQKRTAESNPGIRVVTLSSTAHVLPLKGVKFDSIDAFNAEMGGRDGMPNNLVRYGEQNLSEPNYEL